MDAMRKFAEADERWLGEFGQRLWMKIFEASDLAYIPLCYIETGKAPMLIAKEKTILPDFDVITGKWTAYIDSKAKKQSVLYKNAGEVRHGIDLKNYAHYEAMAFTSRKKAGVAIVELFDHDGFTWSGSLLAESFRNLSTPIRGFSSQAHMIYWPRKRFVDLDRYTPDDLMRIANGSKRVSFEAELGDIFGKTKPHQKALFA